jgi:hypothetical protein
MTRAPGPAMLGVSAFLLVERLATLWLHRGRGEPSAVRGRVTRRQPDIGPGPAPLHGAHLAVPARTLFAARPAVTRTSGAAMLGPPRQPTVIRGHVTRRQPDVGRSPRPSAARVFPRRAGP